MSTPAAQSEASRRLHADSAAHFASMAEDIARRHPGRSLPEIAAAARQTVETVAFLRICQDRGLLEPGTLDRLLDTLAERFGPGLHAGKTEPQVADEPLCQCVEGLAKGAGNGGFPVEILGQVHQQLLGLRLRRDRDGNVTVRRIVTGGEGGIANVHVVRVAKGLPHVHAGYDEVYYVLSGAGTITLDKETYPLRPGSVVVIPAGVPHSLEADSGQELEFVIFGTPPMAIDDERAKPRKA